MSKVESNLIELNWINLKCIELNSANIFLAKLDLISSNLIQ